MGNKRLEKGIMQGKDELVELRLLEELQASEELYTPFYWIEESNGYGTLTGPGERVALKHIEHIDKDNKKLFRKEDVNKLFLGWNMSVY